MLRRQFSHHMVAALPLLYGIFLPTWSSGQDTWTAEQYMSENGLLQNRVHDMVLDRWGALLIGTEGGLVRFDGARFKQIGIRAAEGMKPSRVLEVLPTTDGAYVIRDAGSRQYLFREDSLSSITSDAPTRQYTSRFTGSLGSRSATVKALDPDSAFRSKSSWPNVIRAVTMDDHRWCLRTDRTLLVYQDTVLEGSMDLPPGRSVHIMRLGTHLIGFDEQGRAFRVDPERKSTTNMVAVGAPVVDVRNGHLNWRLFWDPQTMTASLIAADRLYTMATNAKGDTLTFTHVPLILPTNAKVSSVVWLEPGYVVAIGTDTKGLFIYRNQFMRSLLCSSLADGVNNAYNAQAPFGKDRVVTSNRRGVRVFDPSGCSDRIPDIRGFNDVAILLDRNGVYWYGRGDTLVTYDPVRRNESNLRVGLKPMCFLDEGDMVWVGSTTGLHRVHQGVVDLTYPLTGDDLSSRPNALCRTPQKEIWMATCFGVYRLTAKGRWEAVPGLERICARTLEVIGDQVFVGTYGAGAYLVRANGRVLRLPQDEQGFLTHVHAFMPDSMGSLWMSTNQGLFRMALKDLEAWVSDTTQAIFYAYYGKRAGINNAEFNGGCYPSYVRTEDGWASFPTMDGLVWFRPEAIPDAFPTRPIRIESVVVNGQVRGVRELNLPWDHRELVVYLSLAYWGGPENARLEYALDQEEGAWTTLANGQRELHFASIPIGDHILRIRKVGGHLRNREGVVELPIHVSAPLFRRPWFIFLLAVGTVLAFVGLVQLNARRLRKRNAQLEQKVSDRTRELIEANADLRRSLEMKEMLVSIISHDIVTPLRFIARVASGVARRVPEDAERRLSSTLSDLANSSEKLHANAQGLLQWIKRQDGRIELRPRNVVVHLLVGEVFAREHERAADSTVRLVNAVPVDDTIRTDPNVLAIILNNAVANAVTHSAASTISLFGESRGEGYRIIVQDDGIGMPGPVLRHAKRVQAQGALGAMDHEGERDVQGLGLLIMADLMQLLGGQLAVESAEGMGTRIILDLPQDGFPVPRS